MDTIDLNRFWEGMDLFNNKNILGSLERISSARKHGVSTNAVENDRLVEFVAYCLNPNHYHFILKQIGERGIEKFMHKMGMGHSKYINMKHRRSGALFQGSFKAIHIDSNEYLLHLSAYVNLNGRIHGIHPLSKSSWSEYVKGENGICKKQIILDQFKSPAEYKRFAEEALDSILEKKDDLKVLEDDGVELINTL